MEQQAEGILQHLDGFGVAQGFPMQPCQVVPKAGVLPLYPSHVGLAHNLVTLLNEHRIHLPAVSDIKETVPALDDQPQGLEGFCTAITDYPSQNPRLLMIDSRPNPNLVAFVDSHWFAVHPSQ